MKPSLYLKKGDGWHEVSGVEDFRVKPGKFVLEDGREVNGDVGVIIMHNEPYDAGQQALKRLIDIEPRVVDMRIIAGSKLDVSAIISGDEVDDLNPQRWAATCRILGIRPAGQDVEWRGKGGTVL